MAEVSRFLGLNNVGDPLRLGLEWLTQADNVHIDDAGTISRRNGYAAPTGAGVTGAYGTIDTERLFVVAGGYMTTGDGVVLASGLRPAPMHWAEVNDQVFYSNGTDYGIILPDNTVQAWHWDLPASPALAAVSGSLAPGLYRVACTFVLEDGRETGASDPVELTIGEGQALQISGIPQLAGARTRTYIAPADSTVYGLAHRGPRTAFTWDYSPNALGIELATGLTSPVPAGSTVIQHWAGSIYAAQYDPASNTTALWQSLPLGWHLFQLDDDFKAIHGEVLMLAPHDSALLIGTDKAVFALTGEGLRTLANYGVVPGCSWSIDRSDPAKPLYIWTQRGVCRFPEFANLTQEHVSVAPGVQAGAAVMQADGQTRFVVALHQGGTAFNKRI